MKENPNIDELLNSFIDGELTEKNQTEVQCLISSDARIAQRHRELQKCKMLVNSLPSAEAPAQMLEQIKASLEEKELVAQRQSVLGRREGARHLLARRVLAAAAMIGLVAVLTTVIYTIVTPEKTAPLPGFRARLELKTSDMVAVDAVINKAIEDKGILRLGGRDKGVYALSCSREAMNLLLGDLNSVWPSFDSATLFVETKTPGGQVVVENVNAEQIGNLMNPVMPGLTGPEKPVEKPATPLKDKIKVHLTIVVEGSE
jgi:hypothetical protein